jgi:hypothetical protein
MTDQTTDQDLPGGMTAAELAYFQSGGESTDGLGVETPVATPVVPEAVPAATTAATPAAVASPPATPPAADDDGEDIEQPGGTKRRMVDYRALRESRDRYKALEANFAKEREEFNREKETRARLDERLRLLNEALTPPEQEPVAPAVPPDPEKDIFGYVRHLSEQISQMSGHTQQVAETVAANTADTQLRNLYASDARRYAQEKPDFAGAYNHLLGVRTSQLRMQGFSDEEIPAIVMNEERGLVQRAISAKRSPAAMIYEMAGSFGYKTPAASVPTTTLTPTPQPGALSMPAGGQAATPTAAASEEIARIQAAQAASRSLSAGGGSTGHQMTVETLANMPQHEFNAWVRKNPGLARELMGA